MGVYPLMFFVVGVLFAGNFSHPPRNAPYRDGRFENYEPKEVGFGDFLRWILNREKSEWPSFVEAKPGVICIVRQVNEGIRITFVNHSTFLIQVNGLNILTDPVWSERVGAFSFVGPRRVCPPGIDFKILPPIDVVLVSHNHYDHMDLPTLKMLEKKFHPLFITGLGNQSFLEGKGIVPVEELDWWEEVKVKQGISICFVPARHFSGRFLWDMNETLWGGFVIRTSDGAIYFAGDTGFGNFLEEIAGRFSDVRVALLPIGAYKPKWFMSSVHMSPEDAVRAHLVLKPEISIAMHFGTFKLADDGYNEPVEELKKALQSFNVSSGEFIVPLPGETITLD